MPELEQWPDEADRSTDADVPFGNGPDFEFPDDVEAPADLDDGSFPLGPNLFFVQGFDGDPKSIPLRIQVTDPRTGRTQEVSGETMQATLWLALRSNPKRRLKLKLQFPPLDIELRKAWEKGVQYDSYNNKWKEAAGYQSTTTYVFLDRLAHDVGGWPKGQKMPAAIRNTKDWIGRDIIASVQTMPNGGFGLDQRSFQPATPENIKAMEDAKAGTGAVARPNARHVTAPATRPVAPSQQRPAATGQAVQEFEM